MGPLDESLPATLAGTNIRDCVLEAVATLGPPEELRRLREHFDYDPVYREWGFDGYYFKGLKPRWIPGCGCRKFVTGCTSISRTVLFGAWKNHASEGIAVSNPHLKKLDNSWRITMPDEQEAFAVARISHDLSEVYVMLMGKAPDPQALKAEAEEFVAKYGPSATLEDMMG
jgi:hypothetical protein